MMRPYLRTLTCFHRSALYLTLSSICEACNYPTPLGFPTNAQSVLVALVNVYMFGATPFSRYRNRWSSPHTLQKWVLKTLAYPLGSLGCPHRTGVASALGEQRTFNSFWICLFCPIHNFLLCKLLKGMLGINHS